jgi:peptidoglycan/LPS O-acetylase OafA/YrhL
MRADGSFRAEISSDNGESEARMAHPYSPPPPNSLVVPSVPAARRRAPIAGFVVMVGSLAIMLGVWLPWRITHIPSPAITLHIFPALTIALIGTLTLIAGSTIWRKAALPPRMGARLCGCATIGSMAYDFSYTYRVSVPGPGLSLVCVGALLVVVGSFLQRAAPAPERVG